MEDGLAISTRRTGSSRRRTAELDDCCEMYLISNACWEHDLPLDSSHLPGTTTISLRSLDFLATYHASPIPPSLARCPMV
jgi:hypothetical protein